MAPKSEDGELSGIMYVKYGIPYESKHSIHGRRRPIFVGGVKLFTKICFADLDPEFFSSNISLISLFNGIMIFGGSLAKCVLFMILVFFYILFLKEFPVSFYSGVFYSKLISLLGLGNVSLRFTRGAGFASSEFFYY